MNFIFGDAGGFAIVWMALLLVAFAVVFCGLSIWLSFSRSLARFFDGGNGE
jgi:hypothetical protein